MHIGIPAETRPGETRVAATPETIKKLLAAGRHSIRVQAGAGSRAFRAGGLYGPHERHIREFDDWVLTKLGHEQHSDL